MQVYVYVKVDATGKSYITPPAGNLTTTIFDQPINLGEQFTAYGYTDTATVGVNYTYLSYTFDPYVVNNNSPGLITYNYNDGSGPQSFQYYDYEYRPYLIDLPDLFTSVKDVVDFNALSAKQLAVMYSSPGAYGLEGDDVITLPTAASVVLKPVLDNVSRAEGGDGSDLIRGSGRSEYIFGNDDNDTLYGGNPAGSDSYDSSYDNIYGGSGDDIIYPGGGQGSVAQGDDGNDAFHALMDFTDLYGDTYFDDQAKGNDTFNFATFGFSGNKSYDSWQYIDGGPDTGVLTDVNKGRDIMILPGSPADYSGIGVDFSGSNSWSEVRTYISLNKSSTTTHNFYINNVEYLKFREPIDPIDNVVRLKRSEYDKNGNLIKSGNVIAEMLRLADEAYGPLPSLKHKAEELAYETSNPANVTGLMAYRKWHPLSAIELGIKPRDFDGDAYGPLKFSFVNGHYAAYDPTKVGPVGKLTGDISEANAVVLSGIVGGKRTLAISFRGTDQFADFDDYLDFNQHFAKFKPLVDGIKTYIVDAGIEQVLVSGHSLGAGMVQSFLAQFPDVKGKTIFRGFTDGSPGSDAGKSDSRIFNLIHNDDLVTFAPTVTSWKGKIAISAFATFLAEVVPGVGQPVADAIYKIVFNLKGKERAGSDLIIDSGVDSGLPTLAEHNRVLYVRDLMKILEFAIGDNSPENPFYKTPLAAKLRAGEVYTGTEWKIGVGRPQGDLEDVGYNTPFTPYDRFIVNPERDDDFVFGNFDQNDIFVLDRKFLLSDGNRRFDGASGIDIVVLPFDKHKKDLPMFEVDANKNGSYKLFWLDYEKDGKPPAKEQVGVFYRTEKIFYDSNGNLGLNNLKGSFETFKQAAQNHHVPTDIHL